jgi:5-(carboxyamino)imidazole ribonucleotide mutase
MVSRGDRAHAVHGGFALSDAAISPFVAIVTGSKSDWDVMESAAETLDDLGVANEARALSAHRTPDALAEYLASAEARGAAVFIAAAGGAAHLPGVIAARTLRPVIGVPMESVLKGLDSLLSIVQMPAGVPVATMAIGKPGAVNAALFAAAILARTDERLHESLRRYRAERAEKVIRDSELKEMKDEG